MQPVPAPPLEEHVFGLGEGEDAVELPRCEREKSPNSHALAKARQEYPSAETWPRHFFERARNETEPRSATLVDIFTGNLRPRSGKTRSEGLPQRCLSTRKS